MAKYNLETVAFHLLTSPTQMEAANRAGISISTLKRLLKRPDFMEIVTTTKHGLFSEAMQKAQSYSVEMMEVLREIASDSSANDSSRVSAAKGVIELGLHAYSLEAVKGEIDELRRRIDDEKN